MAAPLHVGALYPLMAPYSHQVAGQKCNAIVHRLYTAYVPVIALLCYGFMQMLGLKVAVFGFAEKCHNVAQSSLDAHTRRNTLDDTELAQPPTM